MKNEGFIRFSNYHYENDFGGNVPGRLIIFKDDEGYLYAFGDDARLISRVFGVRPAVIKLDHEYVCMFRFRFNVTPYGKSARDSLYQKMLKIVGGRGKVHYIEYGYQEVVT